MKLLIKTLFFDRDIVREIKKTKLNKEVLYNHLSNGRITLQEYLFATKD